ncbi:msy1p [Saccharomyces arboricola H-6]|uniref:Tyrosine--tRNA ligase n=1 Tax=Saccharomyces arboricola (strain H-6 / AS 2.3317 / CBS 10644) TaxID=1160507 RepID=J8PH41_SACAR|nr:msy1p [Saccharomyces arboricola H-6]
MLELKICSHFVTSNKIFTPLVKYQRLSAVVWHNIRSYSHAASPSEVQDTSNSRSSDILDDLKQRGLVCQVSQPENDLRAKIINNTKIKLYCGVDPTAKSLHLGNLVPLMVLLHFYVKGHDIVTVIGGATGKVGDPSGRKTERDVMESDIREDNVKSISQQLQRFFQNGLDYYNNRNGATGMVSPGKYTPRNNFSWWKDIKMLDFLTDFGKHIRVQSMLARDSVSSRLETQNNLGFNEFTYQILQAYDFYHLYKEENISVQVGGNDQWGNITAGIDLINRLQPTQKKGLPFGITVPLLTTATGEKFGKSAGNAVFIDPSINTAYDVYQFFFNTLDADVPKFLKIFTFLNPNEISAVMERHIKSPNLRLGQTLLAREVTDMLYGIKSGTDSEELSDVIFGRYDDTLSAAKLIELCQKAKILQHSDRKDTLIKLICKVADCSVSEARRKLSQGSVYLHHSRIKVKEDVSNWAPYLIDDQVLILRIGKQKCFIIEMH